jgi:hypothetical protein
MRALERLSRAAIARTRMTVTNAALAAHNAFLLATLLNVVRRNLGIEMG